MTAPVRQDDELIGRAVQMFVEATPPVGAPIEDWRAGFEAMTAQFPVPADAEIEEVDLGGVPARLVRAPGARADAVIVHFHSGGYVMGSSLAYREFAYRLSAATGLAVLVPNYRLAPEHPYPAPVEDAKAVWGAVRERWAPERIVLSGDSAGGGLVHAALLALRDAGEPSPAAAFSISALLDLAGEAPSMQRNAETDPLIDRTMVVEMGKVYIGDIDPHEHPLCSPQWGEHHDLPPMLLLASDSEVLRDDSEIYAEKVRAAGGLAETSFAPGMVHIWTMFPFLPQAHASLETIGDFVRRYVS
jgi:acetyl esterase/lipase